MLEEIIKFATGIIGNGVRSGLNEDQVKNNLDKYIEYLKTQNYMNSNILKVLNSIEKTLPELITLSKSYNNEYLSRIILDKEEVKEETTKISYDSVTDRCGNPITDRCGNPVRSGCGVSISSDRCGSRTVDSCGGGRSLGRSSC
jgi:hypothetical protein